VPEVTGTGVKLKPLSSLDLSTTPKAISDNHLQLLFPPNMSASLDSGDHACRASVKNQGPRRAATFKYAEQLYGDSIRVLELYPGKAEDPIHCALIEVPLEDSEDTYEAVSYVWGDTEKSLEIICNESRIRTTTRLEQALRRLRDSNKPRLLWADAICINQIDNEEKRHQVQRMGRVYENAKRVYAWLGLDTDGIAEDCFTLIQEANSYLDEQMQKYGDFPRIIAKYPISNDAERWANVHKMARLAWFKRLWVSADHISHCAKNENI
jgi:hypothetical protein